VGKEINKARLEMHKICIDATTDADPRKTHSVESNTTERIDNRQQTVLESVKSKVNSSQTSGTAVKALRGSHVKGQESRDMYFVGVHRRMQSEQ